MTKFLEGDADGYSLLAVIERDLTSASAAEDMTLRILWHIEWIVSLRGGWVPGGFGG